MVLIQKPKKVNKNKMQKKTIKNVLNAYVCN